VVVQWIFTSVKVLRIRAHTETSAPPPPPRDSAHGPARPLLTTKQAAQAHHTARSASAPADPPTLAPRLLVPHFRAAGGARLWLLAQQAPMR
jgi:hypothetical protein